MNSRGYKTESLIMSAIGRARAECEAASEKERQEFALRHWVPHAIKQGWVERWPGEYGTPYEMPAAEREQYRAYFEAAMAAHYPLRSGEDFISEEIEFADLWHQWKSSLIRQEGANRSREDF